MLDEMRELGLVGDGVRSRRLPRGRAGRRGRAARGVRPARRGRLPPGAAPRPGPRPAARGRPLHRRRASRCGAGVVVAGRALSGRRRLRRAARSSTTAAGRRSARQPRPDRRPRPHRAASSPRCTRTSGRWSRPAEETERVLAGSSVGLCVDTGHLARRRRRPGGHHAQRIPTASCTCTSRTSTPRPAARVSAGDLTFGAAVRDGHVPAARRRATSTSRAMVRTARGGRLPRAGTCSSRTSCSTVSRPESGPYADVRRSLDFLLRVAG